MEIMSAAWRLFVSKKSRRRYSFSHFLVMRLFCLKGWLILGLLAGSRAADIKKTVGQKVENGKCYILVKWKDLPAAYNTWEAEDAVQAQQLREVFRDFSARRVEVGRLLKLENTACWPPESGTDK
jgi:hypothetical protein